MRILKLATFAVCASILASCAESEECRARICPAEPTKPSGATALEVGTSGSSGWTSVRVEIHQGSVVESGPVHTSWEIEPGGESGRTVWVPEGDWSGHAVYARPGDTLDVYDSDETSIVAEKDECGCVLGWNRIDGVLDLGSR